MNTQLFSNKLLSLSQRFSRLLLNRSYAKAPAAPVQSLIKAKAKKVGKAGPIVEKIRIPVEKDVNKLVNYVCGSNIYVDGTDIKLKPESEYPDWLWNLNIGKPKQLEELDPNTKEYWRRLRKIALRRNNTLAKLKKFH